MIIRLYQVCGFDDFFWGGYVVLFEKATALNFVRPILSN